jgi:diaminohydroxyphosphoribosylaminopyrimidine deaminase/5-amino-6-(5-phosphoribosylamino)uracil reductase
VTADIQQQTYMRRCLDLALLGLGNTAPNPMVGALLVHENTIIGEGYHQQAGGPHAEVNAVNSVKDKSLIRNSTLYVNLEPCSHTGRTPPCAEMIIHAGIPKVIIGTTDPNPLVAGKGILMLERAGIKVIKGILENECLELNRRFFAFHLQKRPYIILKWAQTADGFIDVIREKRSVSQPTWISNEISRMLVHKWRSEEQSILVGTQTAFMDNPRLNVREWPGKLPLRMVIDRSLRLSKNLNLFDNTSPTIVFNESLDLKEDQTAYVRIDFKKNSLESMFEYLHKAEIQSVFVEGGRRLIQSFVQHDLWDEARVFKGNIRFGDGISAPVITSVIPEEWYIREDLLRFYRNSHNHSTAGLTKDLKSYTG